MVASFGAASAEASFDAVAELMREVDNHISAHLAPVFLRLI
jgi:hypothetical protein